MTVVVIGGNPLSSVVLTLVFGESDAFEVISVVIIAVLVYLIARGGSMHERSVW